MWPGTQLQKESESIPMFQWANLSGFFLQERAWIQEMISPDPTMDVRENLEKTLRLVVSFINVGGPARATAPTRRVAGLRR